MENMMETIQLSTPIHFGDQTITEINLRHAVAKDFRGLDFDSRDAGVMLDFAAKLAGIHPAIIDKCSARDTFKLLKIVGKIFQLGEEETG